jgi:uncharacterized protein (DUF2252 family)
VQRLTLSTSELVRRGERAREQFSFDELGTFRASNRDPIELIHEQNLSRLQHLIPLRNERMAASAFSFYRGTAGLMARDLSECGDSGLDIVLCGDAHISNFGLFASPERRLVFDLNDFDEAATGPWEWDVRRFVTSVLLGASSRNFSDAKTAHMALRAAESYRRNLSLFLEMSAYDRLFVVRDEDETKEVSQHEKAFSMFVKAAKKAQKRTRDHASKKLLKRDEDGRSTFIEHPPILVREEPASAHRLEQLYESYLGSTRPDVSLMLSTFTLTDVALRVVGVGSVGTRCYLLALSGPAGEQLILQIKEAQQSVIERYLRRHEPSVAVLPQGSNQGRRVTTYQQVLQATSDPFLGHIQSESHDFYVRQFRDKKGSLDVDGMNEDQFDLYVRACGQLLARAHSQSPLAPAIRGYLGESDEADQAQVRWALAYAKQATADFALFQQSLSGN